MDCWTCSQTAVFSVGIHGSNVTKGVLFFKLAGRATSGGADRCQLNQLSSLVTRHDRKSRKTGRSDNYCTRASASHPETQIEGRWTSRPTPPERFHFRGGVASCRPPRFAILIRDTIGSSWRSKSMSPGRRPLPGSPRGAVAEPWA